MVFCNLTPLDGRFVNAIVFCRKSEFCKYITSLQIQHSIIYVRQFEFFVFTMKQIASIFFNVSFAVQYTCNYFSMESLINCKFISEQMKQTPLTLESIIYVNSDRSLDQIKVPAWLLYN